MADLVDFTVVRNGTANLTVPVWTIRGRVIDEGVATADFLSGVNFPQVLGQLTNRQQDLLVDKIVRDIISYRFGA
jgi:hypothetical protein